MQEGVPENAAGDHQSRNESDDPEPEEKAQKLAHRFGCHLGHRSARRCRLHVAHRQSTNVTRAAAEDMTTTPTSAPPTILMPLPPVAPCPFAWSIHTTTPPIITPTPTPITQPPQLIPTI